MNDQREVIRILAALEKPVLLATILAVEGPSYRTVGTRAILGPGTKTGVLSGGCLELAISDHAKELVPGEATMFWYDSDDDDDLVFGYRTGCGGKVLVLIEYLIPEFAQPFFRSLHEELQSRNPLDIFTIVRGNNERIEKIERMLFNDGFLLDGINTVVESIETVLKIERSLKSPLHLSRILPDSGRLLHEHMEPLPRVLVCGYNNGSAAFESPAKSLGWDVQFFDHRPNVKRSHAKVRLTNRDNYLENIDLDSFTAVIASTHQLDIDVSILESLASKPFFYFGMLGSRKRVEQYYNQLTPTMRKFWQDNRSRIFAPIGLDIHAETPEEIALSVISEIQAVRKKRGGSSLSQSNRPIHNHS